MRERLRHIETQLHQVWAWEGWEPRDKIALKDMAAQSARLADRHTKRATELRKNGVQL